MKNVSTITIDLAKELCLTATKAGFTPAELRVLAKSEDLMCQMRKLLLGQASIISEPNLINLNADPFVPKGWKLEEHKKSDKFLLEWEPAKVELYLDDEQLNGNCIEGNKLHKLLEDKEVLNANVLDYLLANPHLIPISWKRDKVNYSCYIFFWGTVYRDSNGGLNVRYLCWRGSRWDWGDRWLGHGFRGHNQAALRTV